MKLALNSGIQTYQILTNDDEVCIPSLSSILLAVIFKIIFGHILKILDQSLVLQGSVPLLVYYVFIKRKMQFHAVVFLRKLGSTAIFL